MPRDARRAQVLRIAQGLFATEGYHHVSMDDIADHAEVSKPVLYRHFPSKLELYLAVVDQRGAELLSAVEAAVAPVVSGPVRPGEGRDVVCAIVSSYVDFVEIAGESSSLLFESDVTRDAGVREHVERVTSEAARRIAEVLVDVTGLPGPSAAMLAASMTAMAQVAATHRFRSPDGPGPAEAADLVARLAWGGVAGLVRDDFEYDDRPRMVSGPSA
ncbi:TetR/AcrR family transcriptional regulator [Cellulomonas chengniuliangii]|uniref:TetR/AcrR family transcriptional regulator n=1 Tax=Cellulomonas chengniuliangii TaxID=2968084 RepID=A0ABY5KYB4_9CELL|nr:TetR/AcrR family transcriptional regulator [Cellulomonas chengniuliangii]MCC2309766.1 TetR/AcrR family transcriptional regulator [Cellulomonas chengniuliangii]MCC2319062.1 TetR/AcrR family transcriptional regulator [Cellulomonas chengniuliangii]UUI74688.1 TetR/AcrR family transcriptional regulator [Cellulomonas chengniuliangii]